MNLAINNADNVIDRHKSMCGGTEILGADTKPARQRIAEQSKALPEISFVAFANMQANMTRQEGKNIALLSEARAGPSGVGRLIELQKEGYAYSRP
jgi:intracellular sulfur oxidation DsrE/DsrF family protein